LEIKTIRIRIIFDKRTENAMFKFFMMIHQIQCFLSSGPCCFGNPNFIFFMFLSLVVERCERKLIKKNFKERENA
jgi:hypothetical protein